MRRSSFQSIDVSISREVETKYDEIKIVSDDIDHVVTVSNAITDGTFTNVDLVIAEPLKSNINALGPIAADIATVASIDDDIAAILPHVGAIGTVAADIADVVAVSGVVGDVTTVAGIAANVTTVAGIAADVTAVASVGPDVEAVAGELDDVVAVSAALANIGEIVTTVVPNMAEILAADDNAAVATTKAAEASGSAAAALVSEQNADASELLAMKWATETTDTIVADGKFSAKHWAEKAAGIVASGGSVSSLPDSLMKRGLNEEVGIEVIQFNNGQNELRYNSESGTLEFEMNGGTVLQEIGLENYVRIKASSPIADGQLVMVTGAVGASGVLTGAPATGVTEAHMLLGVATETILNNEFGYVTDRGAVRGIDTSAWAQGDKLYYDSAVPGGLTNVEPLTGVNVPVAMVVSSGVNGVIYVRTTQLDENKYELRDSAIQAHIIDTDNPHGVTAAQAGAVAKIVSVDNQLVRFDGTSGEVQGSSVLVSDGGNVNIGGTNLVSAKFRVDDVGTTATKNNVMVWSDQPNSANVYKWNEGVGLSIYNTSNGVGNVSKLVLNTSAGGYNNGGMIHAEGASPYNQGELVFSTGWDSSALATERLRIKKDGKVKIAKQGLQLPNAASTDATTLDWYEEGTFTPTIIGATTAGTTTYVSQLGNYTRIGNQVTCRMFLEWSAFTGTGGMKFGGLPFAPLVSANTTIHVQNMTFTVSPIWANPLDGVLKTVSSGASDVNLAVDTSAKFDVIFTYFV